MVVMGGVLYRLVRVVTVGFKLSIVVVILHIRDRLFVPILVYRILTAIVVVVVVIGVVVLEIVLRSSFLERPFFDSSIMITFGMVR